MQFNELKEQVKGIGLDDLRKDTDNCLEAVIVRDKIKGLIHRLNNFFGKPVWPSWKRLSLQVKETIKDYGGIYKGQTLYFLNQDNTVIFAMLWPWEDGKHITVKIIRR